MSRDFSIYERAMGKMQAREQRRSSGSDFTWLETRKPSRKGEQTRMRLRIVPRPTGSGDSHEEFWVTVDQHMVKHEGRTKALVCPDDHDDHTSEKRCPLCKLSRDLYASRDPAVLQAAKEANARQRVFANVVDLDDDQHPDAPKIWGFSRSIHHSILDICMTKRSFIEDLEIGRDVILTTRRIGPQKFDIRYSVTDADTAPIDPAFLEIANNGNDLETLTKPASLEELHEIAASLDPRKGSKRQAYTPTPDRSAWSEPAPAAPAAPAAPNPPRVDDNPSGVVWHYSGPEGQVEGCTTADVAAKVRRNPGADHHIWREGQAGWLPAAEAPEIAALLTAPPSGPPAPPPAPSSGPPVPPTPREGKSF